MDRNEADAVVLDADCLGAVPTALVRCFHINQFNKFAQGIAVQLVNFQRMVFQPLDERLYKLILLFLYFHFSSETDHFSFQLLLLRFIRRTEHFMAITTQTACNVMMQLTVTVV